MPKDFRNLHNKSTGSKVHRSDSRIDSTGEVFTPMNVCRKMVKKIPHIELLNPKSTFLDPSAGSGNFMMALKETLMKYHSEEHILDNMLYAVEIMEDNHKELCERLGVPTEHPHYVCADALEYDYNFGNPIGVEAFFT